MIGVMSGVPPRSFTATPNTQPAVFLHNGYPQYDGQSRILLWAVEFLGVTRWQLSKLLGTPERNYVYHWLGGQRKMSALYYARLTWLIKERTAGAETHKMKAVNWENGQIDWRVTTDGTKSSL